MMATTLRRPGPLPALVTIASVCSLVAALSVPARGAPAQAQEMRSTQSGVYTTEQAARGETTFTTNCTGCHTVGAYATPTFIKKWNGRPLGELYLLISETMPEDFPGALTPAEYAQVVAWMLRINRMPAGTEELPADAAALSRIRFETAER